MTITIFGATGMVGKQLVQQALFKGHTVKAFGRNVFAELPLEEEKLQLIKGALFDEDDVKIAIKGSDVVFSCLGGDFTGNDKTRSLGMKNIVTQMEKMGIKRIIGIGGIGLLQADEEKVIMDKEDFPKEYLPVSFEHKKAFDFLEASKLDWTFVCPPNILNEGPTGNFITAINYPPTPNKNQINAGDLALFMLGEMERNDFIKQRVGISN